MYHTYMCGNLSENVYTICNVINITANFLTMCHLYATLIFYWFNTFCHIMFLFLVLFKNVICFTKQHFYSGLDCKYLISNDFVLFKSKHWSPGFMIHSRHSDPIPQMLLQILYGHDHIFAIVLNTNFPTCLLWQNNHIPLYTAIR